MRELGPQEAGSIVDFTWDTNEQDGDSANPTTAGAIRIYKDNSAAQRTSANGITDTRGFDSLAGVHHLRIDLADNTDDGFYEVGATFHVVLVGAVIDTKTVNKTLARFSIEAGVMAVVREQIEELMQELNDRGWSAPLTDHPDGSMGKLVVDGLALNRHWSRDEPVAGEAVLTVYNEDGTTRYTRTVTFDGDKITGVSPP
jgi:hypothetical protein